MTRFTDTDNGGIVWVWRMLVQCGSLSLCTQNLRKFPLSFQECWRGLSGPRGTLQGSADGWRQSEFPSSCRPVSPGRHTSSRSKPRPQLRIWLAVVHSCSQPGSCLYASVHTEHWLVVLCSPHPSWELRRTGTGTVWSPTCHLQPPPLCPWCRGSTVTSGKYFQPPCSSCWMADRAGTSSCLPANEQVFLMFETA